MREELVMCLRGRAPGQDAEPVTVFTLGTAVVLTLDDGEELTFDVGELVGAIVRQQHMERAA